MLLSTLTSKGQATIPAKIRLALNLKPGDKLVFVICGHKAIIAKAEPIEHIYHASVPNNLTEWNSFEDDSAYKDL